MVELGGETLGEEKQAAKAAKAERKALLASLEGKDSAEQIALLTDKALDLAAKHARLTRTAAEAERKVCRAGLCCAVLVLLRGFVLLHK